ncbi:MAG TPA: hypothetical protein VM661_04480 [Candidatus Sulfotelmatobacter sp.]|jgi:hypothetical protein|nr:hypothetical protein [Candidatus Sulfotelmatobacter sp.]
MRFLLSVAAACLLAAPAFANDLEYVPAVSDPVVKKECGACHLAYPAKFLNAETWTKITSDLTNHFGEDASLPADKVKTIQAYYTQNAGRSQPGILRISQQSWWLREHRAVGQSKFEKAKSKANCQACHEGADKGQFEE